MVERSESSQVKGEDAIKADHLRVLIRVRPLLSSEADPHAGPRPVELRDNHTIRVEKGNQVFQGSFDKVFGGSATQEAIYRSVSGAVDCVLAGYNASILAYGQTSTGKTHTMMGPPHATAFTPEGNLSDDAGIVPRAMASLFAASQGSDLVIESSYLQVYNERVYDLLVPPGSKGGDVKAQNQQPDLEIRSLNDVMTVVGIEKRRLDSLSALQDVLALGNRNRKTRETRYNEGSSRSHSVLQLHVSLRSPQDDDGSSIVRFSKLSLVDLAGSERWATVGSATSTAWGTRPDSKGEHFGEMSNINQSLTTLGRVVLQLSEGSQQGIPYRESKLTRLLQDSIGGNCTTVIIATISQMSASADESIFTCKFADRARRVRQNVFSNERKELSGGLCIHVTKYEREITRLKRDIVRLKTAGEQGRNALQTPAPLPLAPAKRNGLPPKGSAREGEGGEAHSHQEAAEAKIKTQQVEIARLNAALRVSKGGNGKEQEEMRKSLEEHIALLATEKKQLFSWLEKERAVTERLKSAIRSALNKQGTSTEQPTFQRDAYVLPQSSGTIHSKGHNYSLPSEGDAFPLPGGRRHADRASSSSSSASPRPRPHLLGALVHLPHQTPVPPPLNLNTAPLSAPNRRPLTFRGSAGDPGGGDAEMRPLTDRGGLRDYYQAPRGARAWHEGAYGAPGGCKENEETLRSEGEQERDAGWGGEKAHNLKWRVAPRQQQPKPVFTNPIPWDGRTAASYTAVQPVPRDRLPPPPPAQRVDNSEPRASPRKGASGVLRPQPPAVAREAWGGGGDAAARLVANRRAPAQENHLGGGEQDGAWRGDVRSKSQDNGVPPSGERGVEERGGRGRAKSRIGSSAGPGGGPGGGGAPKEAKSKSSSEGDLRLFAKAEMRPLAGHNAPSEMRPLAGHNAPSEMRPLATCWLGAGGGTVPAPPVGSGWLGCAMDYGSFTSLGSAEGEEEDRGRTVRVYAGGGAVGVPAGGRSDVARLRSEIAQIAAAVKSGEAKVPIAELRARVAQLRSEISELQRF